jgi:hypothetical protein
VTGGYLSLPATRVVLRLYFLSIFFKHLGIRANAVMQMIIANTLSDGFVVFLTEERGWTNDIAEGAIAETDEQAQALLAAGKQAEADNVVIDPYLIPIEIVNGRRAPTEYREYIRANGPSVPIPS